MITESIRYLKDSEGGTTTVLVGGILTMLSVLLVPVLFVMGYLVRVLDATAEGDEEAPKFDDWGELFVTGLKSFLISVAYLLIPAVLAVVFVGGGVLALGGDSGIANAFGALGVLLGTLLTLVVGLALWYVFPAALANFAWDRRMASAFDYADLKPVLTSGKYATGWLFGLAVVVATSFVVGVVAAVPVIGWFAGLFLSFYGQVAAFYIYGRAYGEAKGLVVPDEPDLAGEQAAV